MNIDSLLDQLYKNPSIFAIFPALVVLVLCVLHKKDPSLMIGLVVVSYLSFFVFPPSLKIILSDGATISELCHNYTREVFIGAFTVSVAWVCGYIGLLNKAM
jgi:hypothetical protein